MERRHRDGCRVGTAAHARVQRIDPRELVGGELEAEHVDVGGDPHRIHLLGDGRAALLQVLAQS